MNLDSTLAVTNTCPKDGVPLCWLPYELPAGDDRQISSEDRRSVKLRVRPPLPGTHRCH